MLHSATTRRKALHTWMPETNVQTSIMASIHLPEWLVFTQQQKTNSLSLSASLDRAGSEYPTDEVKELGCGRIKVQLTTLTGQAVTAGLRICQALDKTTLTYSPMELGRHLPGASRKPQSRATSA